MTAVPLTRAGALDAYELCYRSGNGPSSGVAGTTLAPSALVMPAGGTGRGAPEDNEVAGAAHLVVGVEEAVASTEKMLATSNETVSSTVMRIGRPKTFAVPSRKDDASLEKVE